MRLLFVSLVVAVTFGAAAQSSDPFALTPPLVSQAITSCGDLTISGGLVDSSPTAGRGNILSNGNIKVTGGKVDGDATAGPGKTVTRSGSGTITGAVSTATSAFPCSIIDLNALGSTLASANDNASIPLTAQHKNPVSSAGDFTLSGGDSVTLQSGTYYFHKFTISGGSTITLAGPVRILATSDVNITGGSVAGTNPWQLHFWASSTKFVVSSSTLVGFIYAPSAPVTVSAGTVAGGIYGGSVTVSGNSHVTRTIDNTPPTVTIIAPTDHQAVLNLAQVAVHGTVSDPETAITSFQINGADVPLASDGSFDVTLNLSTATPPSITATATNAAGLTATSTVTVQSALTQIAVTPPSLTIDQNATGQLSAIGTYADSSTADVTASATWTSSAPSIATVSAGTVTGVSPGPATITATLGSYSASAPVTVNPLLQSIAVAPSTATVVIGAKQAFTATGSYSDGSTRNLTSSVTWTSGDTGLASIDTTGLATGLSAGNVTIRATSGSISGSATLTVLATPTIASVQPTRGRTSGGDTVTITGTNFGTTINTSVTFGGNTASITSANATTLTVTTPSHAAGSVDVAVTTPTGTATKTGAFTYLAVPTVTSVTPNKGKTNGGDSITVTGSNFDTGGTTTVKIGNAAATNVVVTSPASLTATTPAGTAGVASVTVTTAGGSGTLTSGFTYVPPPSITSFTPGQGPAGTSVTINGTNFDATAANDVVVIGGAPAVVTSATTTRLIATVAANAATGPVSVSTIGGTATAATTFTVLIYRSMSFTSSATAIQIGHQLQFSASVTKFDNTSFDVTSTAVWTSSDSTVATVTPAGLVTAGSAGATDITVAFSGLSATVHLSITTPVVLPPPVIQGPPLDPTIVTPIADTIRFLYSGPNAIQTGVAPNAIADNRAAVVYGRVLDVSGAPLSGVVVTTGQHPEFGQTVTRADGRYDFVWNGGGPLHLTFTKANYIPSDRMVTTKWNQQKPVDDVVLVAYDGAVTTITVGAGTMQVAQGSSVTDNSGTRRATILFPAGTTATLTNADGTMTSASALHVRATELTVGAMGPKAMPAVLPPNSGYTYCVELSVDEAPGVTFSSPLPVYIENFLNFPVGATVPLGYFDRKQLKWLPAANGVVLKILTVANGTVTVDTDGDGVADNAAGLSSDELAQLAALYTAGQTLWRIQVDHFTPFDPNHPMSPPADAIAPNLPQPDAQPTVFAPHKQCGSIVDCENQTLGESIPITGTPYSLNYNSGRTDRVQYQMNVPVTGASVPASLQAITVQISIAGRTLTQSMPIAPNQTLAFTWDGNDAYGRPVEGARTADVSVAYTYPARYAPSRPIIPAFDMPPAGTTIIGDSGRVTLTLQQATEIALGRVSTVGTGFGGWSFSAQRMYDTIGRTLYDGTAQRGSDGARTGEASVYRAAGNGAFSRTFTAGGATQVALSFPTSLAPTADGGFYFVDNGYGTIDYVDPSGNLSLVGGSLSNSIAFTPDGAAAAGSSMNPFMMAVAPDGTVYFSEEQPGVSDRLRKIVNGTLQTVAGGTASAAPLGDGAPIASANLGTICGLAFAPDGVLYISDCGHARVRRVSLNGIITTIAGGGSSSADNIPALQASIGPRGIAVGPDGSLYVADELTIEHITPDGFIHYLGNPNGPPMVDGQPAAGHSTEHFAWGLSVAGDGTVLYSERSGSHDRVWTINGGIAHVLAGAPSGNFALTATGSLARAAQTSYMYDVKAMPDGSVLIADSDQNVIERTGPTFPPLATGSAATIIPSDDGTVGYIFENGHHTRTVNTITGTTLQTLGYDTNGYLTSVTDVDGQATTVERNAAGVPSAIVAPGGQRTTLSVGSQGLSSITDPAGASYGFQYNNLGLLSQLADLRGGIHRFSYDDAGHLMKDEDPAGGFLALTRSGSNGNFAVLRASAEGRTSTVGWQQNSDLLTSSPVVGSDGLTTTSLANGDGSTSVTAPTGSTLTGTAVADSRFGMSAPVTSTASMQMPSGLKLAATLSRQATLSDPNNVLSVTSFVETLAVNGRTFRSTYTSSNRTAVLTSPLGRTETTVLDTADRPVSVQIPGLTPLTFGYEAHGLLSSLARGSRQTSFTYDDKHRLKTVTDSLSRTVSYDYNSADRVTGATFPDGRQIGFNYDAAGNLTSVTPPSRPAHGFTPTPVDLISLYTPPALANVASAVTTYTYNRDRQLTSVLRPDGASIVLGYDSARRLSTLTEPLGAHQLSYDTAKGNLTSITAPNATALQFTYDGDLLKSAVSTSAIPSTVGFGYDSSFRLTSESVNGANSIAFGYDNDDLLASAGALTLRHDASNGLLTGTTIGNLVDAYGYNSFGDVTSYTVQLSGSPIITFGYTRDTAGRISTKSETVNGQTTTTSYGYDSVGQLTDVTTGSATTHYGYDDNGNRTSIHTPSGTIPATYDAQDRLTTYDGASYFYSDNGELQKKIDAQGTTQYSYDALGNLRSVALPDGRSIEYVIDAANRRVGKKVNGTLVTGWIYADQLRIIAETDGAGAVTKRFVYASRGNVPDYMLWQGGTYRILADHLGSPRYVLETNGGTLAESITYDEFGNVLSDTNSGFIPLGFAGGLYDRDTGLVRFGARDYDPRTGRWTAKDPLVFAGGGTNSYEYATNDPINLVDDDGLRVYPANFVGPLQPGDTREYAANLNDPRLVPLQYPTYGTAPNYYYPSGTPTDLQQQCVSFTKNFGGVPCTSCWRAGRRVVGNNIPPGTPVATFVNGRYPQGDEPKNSGIYLYPGPNGSIIIIDQWPGHPARARQVNAGGGPGRSNDANAYSTISAPQGECSCGVH